MEHDPTPVKGIHISRMNWITSLATLALYVLLTVTVVSVSGIIQSNYQDVGSFTACNQMGEMFQEGSRYLTEQVRLYVTTEDPARMEDYFFEIHTQRRRDGAANVLEYFDLEEETAAYLQSALDRSNALVEREIYAMALSALAQGAGEEALPQEVRDAPLTPEDRALPPGELTAKARELVYGWEYRQTEEQISCDMDDFLYALTDFYGPRMDKNYDRLHRAMLIHQALIGLHFTATLVGAAFTLFLVVLPMRRYVKDIEARKPLRVSGAYECKRLAQAYNRMLACITANERALRRQAEHDALTGLLNRGAFNSLQESLTEYAGPLALLLVDVDNFKQVNDGCGHEAGDRVLQKVAGLLKGKFRAADYPARIGGDEFAVIVMDAPPEEREAIAAKIAAINELLTHPDDGLPPASLSVGGAFSGAGFDPMLFNQADEALYQVKEGGRCGCRFYTPEPPAAEE